MPARFRDRLSGELILTRGNDGCLYLFTEESWEPLAAKLNALPTGDEDARNLRRAVFSSAEPVELDKQGRVIIPDHLRQYAGISSDVSIIGLGEYIEIWDTQSWQKLDARDRRESGRYFVPPVGAVLILDGEEMGCGL